MHVANGTGRALRPAFVCSTLYGEQAGLDRWKPGFCGSLFAAAERRSRSAPELISRGRPVVLVTGTSES